VFPGWVVARAISPDVWSGLLTGKYLLHGGVIRYAAGTTKGGQIVRHLIPTSMPFLNFIPGVNVVPELFNSYQLLGVRSQLSGIGSQVQQLAAVGQITPLNFVSNLINTYQLQQLSGQVKTVSAATQSVLQLATGTAVLSGIGLTVSAIGFAVLHKKLSVLEESITAIQKDVREIREFLERSERASLQAALHDLLNIRKVTNAAHRDTLLHNSRDKFAQIHERYKDLLATKATTLEALAVYEEYFALTGLARTRCTAELGELNLAHNEMVAMHTYWQQHARRIAKRYLLGKYPERFLFRDFAEELPFAMVMEWLDFANNETKGYLWIDELRKRTPSWCNQDLLAWGKDTIQNSLNMLPNPLEMIPNPLEMVPNPFQKGGRGKPQKHTPPKHKEPEEKTSGNLDLRREQEVVIPALQKLVARNNVFEGFIAQYEILEAVDMTPIDFEQALIQLPEKSIIDGYFILEPEVENSKKVA